MKVFLLFISVIALVVAMPADYKEQSEELNDNLSVNDESNENASNPTGIFTKYPEDPYDSYSISDVYELPAEQIRIRRNVNGLISNSTKGGSQSALTQNSNQPEMNTDEPIKVPLRGVITAVESDLVTKASQINAQLRQQRRRRRSPSDGNIGRTNSSTDYNFDAYANLFEGLSNITRSHRESGNEKTKIALDDIVDVVELTLINSAENLRERKAISHKNDTLIENIDELHRVQRDTVTETTPPKESTIQVQKLDSTNLDLLSPITFKPTTIQSITEPTTNASYEETIATTKDPVVQKTNLDVVHVVKTISVIPSDNENVTHIQQQQISTTVFRSNLAIFPTISPHTINTSSSHAPVVSATETSDPEAASTSTKVEKDELRKKAEKIKEMIAEIEAQPVIFSTI